MAKRKLVYIAIHEMIEFQFVNEISVFFILTRAVRDS